MRVIKTKVAGVTHINSDGKERQEIIKKFGRKGLYLYFKREKDNPFDENAISIWIKPKGLFSSEADQIGYIKKELAPKISQRLAKGEKIEGRITEITGGKRGKPTYGVNIEIKLYE